MKTFRTILFWMHLGAGSVAGIVILIMSVTGVALTYEKQMLEWADRRAWAATVDAEPLAPEILLARIAAQTGSTPLSLTLRSDRAAPATVMLTGNKALLIDPTSGRIIGEPPTALRTFFRTMTSWHRYLARDGASRATGRSITGAANLLFLFIVLSGLYLWLPRVWTWIQFRNVLWFRATLSPKARDFNWHNVIGIWTVLPLTIIVVGAVPISYRWAGNLVYGIFGEEPPVPPSSNARPRGPEASLTYVTGGVDAAWASSKSQIPAWRTMTTRLATTVDAPVTISVDEGYGGQPQKRSTFTFDRATGALTKTENFNDLSAGRQLRSWLRFAHTGEFYGVAGQTVAGLASGGGGFLVYTGLALAVRRLFTWIGRNRVVAQPEEQRRRAA